MTSSHFLPRSQSESNRSRQNPRELTCRGDYSLIDSLGLTTKLSEYNVPKEDIPRIVEKTVGKSSGELYDQVVEVMEKAF